MRISGNPRFESGLWFGEWRAHCPDPLCFFPGSKKPELFEPLKEGQAPTVFPSVLPVDCRSVR
jgi:hypothetical protein